MRLLLWFNMFILQCEKVELTEYINIIVNISIPTQSTQTCRHCHSKHTYDESKVHLLAGWVGLIVFSLAFRRTVCKFKVSAFLKII